MNKSVLISNLVTRMHESLLSSKNQMQLKTLEFPLPEEPPPNDPPIPPEMPVPPEEAKLASAQNRLFLTRKVFVELATAPIPEAVV